MTDRYSKAWWVDFAERVIWTFIQGFLGILLADGFLDSIDLTLVESAIGGGLSAALAVVKTVAAKVLSDSGSAQLGPQTYSYRKAGPGAAGTGV